MFYFTFLTIKIPCYDITKYSGQSTVKLFQKLDNLEMVTWFFKERPQSFYNFHAEILSLVWTLMFLFDSKLLQFFSDKRVLIFVYDIEECSYLYEQNFCAPWFLRGKVDYML